ncbi:TPA: hypothetical protein EYP26_05740 [Candidatus Bathyarchaeota archaeon]|nr:hypothetical protein [Candidatus Bathyarchaeota archaeon]
MEGAGLRLLAIAGLILVGIGLALIALTFLAERVRPPSLETLEKAPKILIYVYRKDNLFFITSPILILAGVAYFLWILLRILR